MNSINETLTEIAHGEANNTHVTEEKDNVSAP